MEAPNKKNIQGDIWPRLPKKAETFLFFRITKPREFKNHMSGLIPLLTTADDAFKMRQDIYHKKAAGTLKGLIQLSAINVAFSATGLKKLGAEEFNDAVFNGGMYKDMTAPLDGETKAEHQGLDDQHEWFYQFKPHNGTTDGVFIVCGDSQATVDKTIAKMIEPIFQIGQGAQSAQKLFTQSGNVLPNDIEHFGWVDGISQPLVIGLDDMSKTKMERGMQPTPPGVILVGNKGDEGGHPAWAKDGSFMVFRTYEQKVPEFTMWCAGNIPNVQRLSELNDEERAQALYELRLFSSRVVGRWPEGAPLELHPTKDPNPIRDADPVLSQQKLREEWGAEADKKFAELERTNKTDNFNYDPKDQTRCPFASHIRKCGPRNDHPGYVKHLMLRRGIPYGPMTTPAEKQGGISQVDRGLLFVSYQSSITNGFRTIQKGFANNANAPQDKTNVCGGDHSQGIDPLIGQVHPKSLCKGDPLTYRPPVPRVNLPDLAKPVPRVNKRTVGLERFIIPRGGEYFFAPSISGLQDHLCKV